MSGNPPTRVRSADGTSIALERVTDGPRTLLTAPGGPSLRDAWGPVARLLDGRYATWLMDRRGKGDSGDTEPYSLAREYDDVAAAVGAVRDTRDTGVRDTVAPVTLAGHSSGAICALGAALHGAPVTSLVLYEPPWPLVRDPGADGRREALEARIADDDRDGAVTLALREVVGVPAAVVESMRGSPAWQVWRSLIHLWPRELREIAALPPDVGELASVTVPTLMLVGEHSPTHLRDATTALAAVLPQAIVVELPGQGHEAVATAPDVVAAAIREHAG